MHDSRRLNFWIVSPVFGCNARHAVTELRSKIREARKLLRSAPRGSCCLAGILRDLTISNCCRSPAAAVLRSSANEVANQLLHDLGRPGVKSLNDLASLCPVPIRTGFRCVDHRRCERSVRQRCRISVWANARRDSRANLLGILNCLECCALAAHHEAANGRRNGILLGGRFGSARCCYQSILPPVCAWSR